MVFPAVFDVLSLNGQNGFVVINGTSSITRANDLNNDGFNDILIEPGFYVYDDDTYHTKIESTNVLFGRIQYNSTLTPNPDGITGFEIQFSTPLIEDDHVDDRRLIDVRNSGIIFEVGDVNGDKISDIIAYDYLRGNQCGDPHECSNYKSGQLIDVILGNSTGFPATFVMDVNDFTGGFSFDTGQCTDRRGGEPEVCVGTIEKAGDINGDNIGDILINGDNDFAAYGSLSTNNSFFQNGVAINNAGNSAGNVFGLVGDINHDNIDDFMVSGNTSQLCVIFGSKSFSNSFDITTINGANGFFINSTADATSSLGDVNNDGIDDFIIGTGDNSCNNTYVIFGNKNGFYQQLDLNSLNGLNGFVISSTGPTDWLGDINNDGINDIIVSTNVIYGSQNEFRSPFNVSELNGKNGFIIANTKGQSVSGLGDVNGDKIDDFAIDNYVIFGQSSNVLEGDLNV